MFSQPLISRRAALQAFGSIGVAALAAACGSSGSSPSSAGGSQASGQPQSGGTLRTGLPGDIATLDPHQFDNLVVQTTWLAYDRLIQYDEKLKPTSRLAESWELSSDAKTLEFKLRKGVHFHTGREFTSADVKYNLERVRKPNVASGQFKGFSSWWTTIDTPDDYTVVLKSEVSRPGAFDLFEYLNMGDKETLEGPDAKTKVIGTGPFVFGEWVPGDHIHLTRNKDYWLAGGAHIDEIQAQIFTDTQAMIASVQAGATDMAIQFPVREAIRLKSDNKFQVSVNPLSGQYYMLPVNTDIKPLDNKLVRQALSYAFNRKRFTDTVWGGLVQPRVLPWAPTGPAYDEAKNSQYGYDLDKARDLMKQANVTSADLEVIFASGNAEIATALEMYQADLQQIGIKLTLKPMDRPAWQTELNRKPKATYKGLDMHQGAYGQIESSSVFFLSNNFNPEVNTENYVSEQYTKLVQGVSTEADPTKRKALYEQLNDEMLDDCVRLIVSAAPGITVTSSKVQGLTWNVHEGIDYEKISLSS